MPWSGTGIFTPTASGYPAVGGTTILASFYNAMISDITGVGFINCLTRDGQGKPSAQIDWNSQNLVNVQNLTVLGTATFTGGVTYSGDLTFAGNLISSAAAKRFQADFTNAVIASRFMLQTSTVNAITSVGTIPNGTGASSFLTAFNNSVPTNAAFLSIGASVTEASLASGITGAGAYLPMTFYTNGLEQMRLLVNGNFGLGTATPDYSAAGRGFTIESNISSALELASSVADGTGAVLGLLECNYRTNTATYQRIANVTFLSDGTTANQRGGALSFRTKANAVASNPTERYRISEGGVHRFAATTPAYDSTPLDGTYGLHLQADSSGVVHVDSYSSGGSTSLEFGTNSGGGAVSTKMSISAGGLVGINVNAAAGQFLQVRPAANKNISISDTVSLGGSVALNAINDAGSANIPMELRASEFGLFGAAGNLFSINPTGDVSAKGVGFCLTKAADTSRNTTTVLANDPDLQFALAANTTYEVRVHALFAGPLAAGMGADLKLAYTGTLVANNGKGTVTGPTTSFALVNTFAINTTMGITSVQTVQEQMDLVVSFRTNAAGTLSLQWCQHTSNGNNLTMYTGSSMIVTKLS